MMRDGQLHVVKDDKIEITGVDAGDFPAVGEAVTISLPHNLQGVVKKVKKNAKGTSATVIFVPSSGDFDMTVTF
jgi:hypothetical protein